MNTQTLRSESQLKSLQNAKPLSGDDCLSLNDIKLDTLHMAIQISMGWTNSHLRWYITKDAVYGLLDDDFGFDIKENKFRLSSYSSMKKEKRV